MKKVLSLALVTFGCAAVAQAHGYGDQRNGPTKASFSAAGMSCSEVQNAINERGAAIVYESPDIFDRYVSSGAYCPAGTYEKTAWIMTEDTDACPVSRCQNEDRGGGSPF